MSLLALVGFMVVVSIFMLSSFSFHEYDLHDRIVYFFIGLFLSGGIVAGTFFTHKSDKGAEITFLMTPVSAFEKFLTAIVIVFPIYFLIYYGIYYVLDTIVVTMVNSMQSEIFNEKPHSLFTFFSRNKDGQLEDFNTIFMTFISFYIVVLAFFLAGSAYFKKLAILKSFLTGFLIFILLALFTLFLQSVFGNFIFEKMDNVFENRADDVPANYFMVGKAFYFYIRWGMTILFLTITYFLIREHEAGL